MSEILSEIEEEENLLSSVKTEETENTAPPAFSLAYDPDGALDPFHASGVNRVISRLCYDGLFTVNDRFEPVPVMAASCKFNGRTATIYLRDLVFTDGSPLTAEDCVASYRYASTCENFSEIFSEIASFSIGANGTFQIVFRSDNLFDLNLLTVPIVKAGTEGASCVGNGRYSLQKNGEGHILVRNAGTAYDGDFGLKTIPLIAVSSDEDLLYAFNYGDVSALDADLTDGGEIYRGGIELFSYPENMMTYLAVNRESENFTYTTAFSEGISYAINRVELVAETYTSHGEPVWYPFHPNWKKTVDAALNQDIYATVSAHESFVTAGFTLKNARRVYGKNEDPVILRLLVNQESPIRVSIARMVAADLENMGFEVDLQILYWDRFCEAIEDGAYDLYLAEAEIPLNMSFYDLFTSRYLSVGIEESDLRELLDAFDSFTAGETDLRTVLGVFRDVQPLIPLLYTNGALALKRNVTGDIAPWPDDLFATIDTWEFE